MKTIIYYHICHVKWFSFILKTKENHSLWEDHYQIYIYNKKTQLICYFLFYIPYVSKILWFLSFSVWVFPLSIKNKQQNKLVDTENGMVVTRGGKGCGRAKCNGGQIYGNGKKSDFRWWVLNRVQRYWIIILCTWELRNISNQYYSNKFNLKKIRCWL